MKVFYALIPCFVLLGCALSEPNGTVQSVGDDQTAHGGDGDDGHSNLDNYQARYYQYATLTLQDDSGKSIEMELKFTERQDMSGCLIERATVCVNPGAKKEEEDAKSERIEYLDLEYYQWWRNRSQAILRYIGHPSTDGNSYPRLSLTCDDKASDKGVQSVTSVRYASNTSNREDLDDNRGDGTVAVYKTTVKDFNFIDRWADGHCGEVHSEDEPEEPKVIAEYPQEDPEPNAKPGVDAEDN